MTEHKFTEAEVIKALECCSKGKYHCDKQCPYYYEKKHLSVSDCRFELLCDLSNLINRQKAEIERLEKGELSKAMTFNSGTIKRCVNEAIKEFAERLKKAKANSTMDSRICTTEMIDNLVKEMTEGKEC